LSAAAPHDLDGVLAGKLALVELVTDVPSPEAG